jgi:hypothetical protein
MATRIRGRSSQPFGETGNSSLLITNQVTNFSVAAGNLPILRMCLPIADLFVRYKPTDLVRMGLFATPLLAPVFG